MSSPTAQSFHSAHSDILSSSTWNGFESSPPRDNSDPSAMRAQLYGIQQQLRLFHLVSTHSPQLWGYPVPTEFKNNCAPMRLLKYPISTLNDIFRPLLNSNRLTPSFYYATRFL